MAKFCTKCGKPLEDGKPCNCSEEVLSSNTENSKNTNELVNNLLTVLKGTFKNPITTMKKVKNENYFMTGIITLIASVIGISLFLAGLLKSVIETAINKNSITSTLSYISGSKAKVDINVFGLWFKILIVAAIFYGLYSLIAWLITNKIMKRKNSYKEIIATLSLPATISATTMIVSWLFVLLFGTTGAGSLLYSLVFSFGSVLFTVYLYHSLIIGTDVKADYAGYTHFASMFIASFVVGLIAIAMLSSYINSAAKSYTPSGSSLFGYISQSK